MTHSADVQPTGTRTLSLVPDGTDDTESALVQPDDEGRVTHRGLRVAQLVTVGLVAATALACSAVIAVVQLQVEMRATFLSVFFAAFLGWLVSRLAFRRTVRLSLITAAVAVFSAVLGDFLSAVWGLTQLGLTISDGLSNPSGVLGFLRDRVWSRTDYLLWAASAVVAAAVSWPVPASNRSNSVTSANSASDAKADDAEEARQGQLPTE